MKRGDIKVGQRIHLFTVISIGEKVEMRCACGGIRFYRVGHVGHIRGCSDCAVARNATGARTHGLWGTSIYSIWSQMIRRCTDPKCKLYKNYGARGIAVCDRWLLSVENFISDVGPRPSLRHSIDRINNDGNYEPGNCRWATRKQQNMNRRGMIALRFRGQEISRRDFARLLGMPRSTVLERLNKGQDVEALAAERGI